MKAYFKWILAGVTVLLMQTSYADELAGDPNAFKTKKNNRSAKCNKPPKPQCTQPTPPTQICPDECDDPCCPPIPVPVLNAGYDYPAVVRPGCSVDMVADVSFIYFQPIEENLELGYMNRNGAGFSTPLVANAPIKAKLIPMDFDYKPGFKLGLGGKFDHDDWDLHGEYMYFYSTQHTSANAPANSQIFPQQGLPVAYEISSIGVGSNVSRNIYKSAKATWKLGLNTIDLDLGRAFYAGTKITFRPNIGLRSAMINQHYNITYVNPTGFGYGSVNADTIKLHTNSWSIGPKVGLDLNWMLGAGFRLFGNAEADILYTRYTANTHREFNSVPVTLENSVTGPINIHSPSIGTLRRHLDLGLGFGWGSYFYCNSYYVDIAVGYDFQVFFDQNMFRKFFDDINWLNSFSPNGNLYLQGLTVSAKLDF